MPIHRAAQWGSYEICKFIIENGGDPNPTDNYGTSALECAGTNERIRDLILKNPKKISKFGLNMFLTPFCQGNQANGRRFCQCRTCWCAMTGSFL